MTILFDLDGTLSEPRRQILKEHQDILNDLCTKHVVGIVTGSNLEYILEQVPAANNIFLCPNNGSEIYYKEDKLTKLHSGRTLDNYPSAYKVVAGLWNYFEKIRDSSWYSQFYGPVGDIIQVRPSMFNFCPIGRGSDFTRRAKFARLDKELNIRKNIINDIGFGWDVVLGGETSFDIFPKGLDKTNVLGYFTKYYGDDILFFGNSFFEYGNDVCMRKVNHHEVNSPEETFRIVRELC